MRNAVTHSLPLVTWSWSRRSESWRTMVTTTRVEPASHYERLVPVLAPTRGPLRGPSRGWTRAGSACPTRVPARGRILGDIDAQAATDRIRLAALKRLGHASRGVRGSM